jgi:hypothetical protein
MIRGTVRVALFGCCLVALEAALLAAFCNGWFDWPMALTAHLALSLVVVLVGRSGAERREAVLQLAAWTALLGPFGALIGMTLVLPGAACRDVATPEAEGDATPGRIEALHNTLLDGRLRLGGAHGVRPLLDIVIEGTTAEKLDALGLIAKRYVPALAPALRRGLEDGDASVRVLAATVMAQLHNGHTRRIGALQEAAQAVSTPAAWRALGEARLGYATSGLLETDRARREADEGTVCLARADALEFTDAPPAQSAGAPDVALEAVCDAA